MKPLAWHQECLDNATIHVEREEQALARDQARVARNRASVEAAKLAIEDALKRGKTELPI